MKIAKIYLIFGIVVTLMSILLLHPNSRALAQEQFLTYENAELGISIQYPSDWYNSNGDDGSIRLQSPLQNASDMFLEQVTISSYNITLCGNASPQYDILNRMVAERIKSGVNLKINESKPIVLRNGNAANKLVYTFFDPKYGMLKGQDIVIIKSNKMYSIQYYAQSQQYSYYLPIIQQMLDSFQILNSNGTIKTLPPNIGNQTSKLLEYTNNQYGISMQYPADWNKEEIDATPRDYDVDLVQFYSPSCPLEYKVELSITIRLYDTDTMPKNINEEYEYVIDRGNVFSTNFKIIESYNNATLSGYPAYKLVWTEAINDTGIKVMEMGIISSGHVYAMEYRAEPERYSYYLPIIQQMLDSLKIKELKSIVATDD